MVLSGGALALALYLSSLAALDGAARRIFAGEAARSFAAEACAAISGCKAAEVRGGFDWSKARRRVIYAVVLAPGAEGPDLAELSARAAKRDGLLGWALRAESVTQIQRQRPSAPAPTRKGKRS